MHPRARSSIRRAVTALAIAPTLLVCSPAPGALAGSSRPQASDGLAILITTRVIQPRVHRTVGFDGYASYSFMAPRGRKIVSASARILGGEAHALRIRSRVVSLDRTRYTVGLVFPGEQGTPGKLVVRLGTVA